jgi:hypothetical protein
MGQYILQVSCNLLSLFNINLFLQAELVKAVQGIKHTAEPRAHGVTLQVRCTNENDALHVKVNSKPTARNPEGVANSVYHR